MNRKGFTLIELLIVVAIIAILAAIAVPNFLEAQCRAKVSKALAHMRTLAVACEAFHVDHNVYIPHWTNPNSTSGNFVQDRMDSLWTPRGCVPPPVDCPKASLTSPIAYITGFITDPFMEAHAYVDSGGFIADYAWAYGTNEDAQAFVFESRGPDRMTESPTPGGYAPAYAVDSQFLYLYRTVGPLETKKLFLVGDPARGWRGNYDPTNGSVSRGDISRFSY